MLTEKIWCRLIRNTRRLGCYRHEDRRAIMVQALHSMAVTRWEDDKKSPEADRNYVLRFDDADEASDWANYNGRFNGAGNNLMSPQFTAPAPRLSLCWKTLSGSLSARKFRIT